MKSHRARFTALALASALIAFPAMAQQRPAAPAAPPAPAAPAASDADTLMVSHTLSNLTTKAMEVVIRTDGQELFRGRVDGRAPTATEADPVPELKPVVGFEVPEQKTLFWEVVYTALPEDDRASRQQQAAKAEAPKFCRQAWTAQVAPGAEKPTFLIPAQLVNSFGTCNFAIETTDEAVFDIALKMDVPPQ
ncbi:MAG: hypothetical protein RLY86_470 [Pseudomonadota bacterium]|jgi:hypothetical protein